jgi:pyruvate/2-oxoglutarate dehydrogenase complex dihydrolipoamide dehydrogenase (E3) component
MRSDEHIPFDGQRIFTSDDVLTLELPRSLTVGAVIGCEFACIFATLGVRVAGGQTRAATRSSITRSPIR